MASDRVSRHWRDDSIDLVELSRVLWRGKWIVVGVTAFFITLSVIYALTATEWYRADVLLISANDTSGPDISGALGGLAGLAGVRLGDAGSAESLAVLSSREFTRDFIEEQGLLSILFPDAPNLNGTEASSDATLDIRDAVEYFDRTIRTVEQDSDTGLITLSVEWTDSKLAADWANQLVERANERMREQALLEAQRNVAYLEEELTKTGVVTLQQSISHLLENELQKLMLARGNKEFAFHIIDRARAPKFKIRPKRTLVVLVATFVGFVLSVFIVLVTHAVQKHVRARQE